MIYNVQNDFIQIGVTSGTCLLLVSLLTGLSPKLISPPFFLTKGDSLLGDDKAK